MGKLQDFSAVVTGGSKGIGRSMAAHLYAHGASVVICGRDGTAVDETCKALDASGIRCAGIEADVSKVADAEKLIQFAIKRFGKIDLLINNAGVYGDINEFNDADLNHWTQAIEVNLLGVVYCTKFAINQMVKQGEGKIINLAGAGVGGQLTLPRRSAYYTSKAAVVAFTETIADEVKIHNIKVNAIAPGAINTGFTDYLIEQGPTKAGQEAYDKAVEQQEKGGDPIEKTLSLLSFLCSSEANHISGRLLSAKWDSREALLALPKDGDLFKLRRIDEDLFHGT